MAISHTPVVARVLISRISRHLARTHTRPTKFFILVNQEMKREHDTNKDKTPFAFSNRNSLRSPGALCARDLGADCWL